MTFLNTHYYKGMIRQVSKEEDKRCIHKCRSRKKKTIMLKELQNKMKISQIRSAFQDIKEYIKINCSFSNSLIYFLFSVTHILAFRFQNSMRFASIDRHACSGYSHFFLLKWKPFFNMWNSAAEYCWYYFAIFIMKYRRNG